MKMLNKIHKTFFKDHIRLNAPDYILSLKLNDTHKVVCRYSDYKKLKEYHKVSPFPLPTKLYLILDDNLGKHGIPKVGFIIITSYGMYEINIQKLKVDWETVPFADCTACSFGGVICEKHINNK